MVPPTNRLPPLSVVWLDLVLAVGFVLCWSSGFIGARLGTVEETALTLLAWRFLAGSVLVAVWWLVRPPRLERAGLPTLVLVGLLTQAGYLAGVVGGISAGVPAGTAALIAALQPALVATLSGPLLGERVTSRQWLGLLVGIAGVALVVLEDLDGGSAPGWAYLLPAAGMVALVAGTLVDRRRDLPGSVVDSWGVHTLAATALLVPWTAAAGQLVVPSAALFWWAVLWTVTLSSVGGYGFYLANLRRRGATRTSSLLYLTPPTTMLWAFAMFGQGTGPVSLAGVAVCAVAVALVLRPARETPPGEPLRSMPWHRSSSRRRPRGPSVCQESVSGSP